MSDKNKHLIRDIQPILKNPQHDHSEGAKARTKKKRREEAKHIEVNRSHQELEEELLGRAEVAKGVPRDPQKTPKIPQGASKTPPRAPKTTPREPQNACRTIIGYKTLIFQKTLNVLAEIVDFEGLKVSLGARNRHRNARR